MLSYLLFVLTLSQDVYSWESTSLQRRRLAERPENDLDLRVSKAKYSNGISSSNITYPRLLQDYEKARISVITQNSTAPDGLDQKLSEQSGTKPQFRPSESCDAMENRKAGDYTCGDRMNWLETTKGYSNAQAYTEVNSEYPSICVCDNPPTGNEGSGAPVCVFDIDGTLLNGVDEKLSRAAISACQAHGYNLAVNTAESKSECAGNRGRLEALGLSVPDAVYTCLSNYDWGVSKSLNMRTISSYYGSSSKCTLLFDDNQGNIDAVRNSGWLGQKVHSQQPGISADELQRALDQLDKCRKGTQSVKKFTGKATRW